MNISMKKGLLALAGAVALAGAGSAQAQQFVMYEGPTRLVSPIGTTDCSLHLGGYVDGLGVTIEGAWAEPGSATCALIELDGFIWPGTLSAGPSSPGTVTISGVEIFAGGSPICGAGPFTITADYTTWSAGWTTATLTPDSFTIPPQTIGLCSLESFGGPLERGFP